MFEYSGGGGGVQRGTSFVSPPLSYKRSSLCKEIKDWTVPPHKMFKLGLTSKMANISFKSMKFLRCTAYMPRKLLELHDFTGANYLCLLASYIVCVTKFNTPCSCACELESGILVQWN